ncbi:MAG: MerR family transcriptional regulator [Parvularculaceae bacterium]
MSKSPEAFRTISEAAKQLDLPQHVLRHWEDVFGHIRPMRRAGGRRYYRKQDIELLNGVRTLLYDNRYTTKGVQKIFKENGQQHVADIGRRALNGDTMMPLPETVSSAVPAKSAPVMAPSNNNGNGTDQAAPIRATQETTQTGVDPQTRESLTGLLSRLEKMQDRLDEVIVATGRIGLPD